MVAAAERGQTRRGRERGAERGAAGDDAGLPAGDDAVPGTSPSSRGSTLVRLTVSFTEVRRPPEGRLRPCAADGKREDSTHKTRRLGRWGGRSWRRPAHL